MPIVRRRKPQAPSLRVEGLQDYVDEVKEDGEQKEQKPRRNAPKEGCINWMIHNMPIDDKNKVCTLANIRGCYVSDVIHEAVSFYFENNETMKKELASLFNM